jgi:membrane protease subunit HflK
MAWNSQGGGGSPWGNNGGGENPWKKGSGGNGGKNPNDLEDVLRKGREKFDNMMPSGFGGGKAIALVIFIVVAIWASSGFYRVQPGEQAVELLFGEYVKTTEPGLNYWLPAPIGEYYKQNVQRINQIEIGFRGNGGRTSSGRDVPAESLMLTGDENIIDMDFVVQWQINNLRNYLFNLKEPDITLKTAAESAVREVVAGTTLTKALTTERSLLAQDTAILLQSILDSYGVGVTIVGVEIQAADPPKAVIDAFNDVQNAKQDKERLINEAQLYSNDIIPRAKGLAQRMVQEAEAYKDKVKSEAQGEAEQFNSLLNAYAQSKDVTINRLYLEAMQQVMEKTQVFVIDQDGENSQGVVPYLPLGDLNKKGAK